MNCQWCGKPIENDSRRTMHKECREAWREKIKTEERNGLRRPLLTWGETIGAAMRRDDYTCQECGKKVGKLIPGTDLMWRYGAEVHHKIPYILGGSHNLENLITLCHDCHLKAHPKGYKKTARRARENQTLTS
jgi:5-methylcytosine-specific restriction endonuclease McrA